MKSEHSGGESAYAYISKIKEQYPPRSSEPVNISKPLLELHGKDESKVKDMLQSIRSDDYAQSLLY